MGKKGALHSSSYRTQDMAGTWSERSACAARNKLHMFCMQLLHKGLVLLHSFSVDYNSSQPRTEYVASNPYSS